MNLQKNIQRAVNGSLDTALRNGYDQRHIAAQLVAEDLVAYDSLLEDYAPERLVPYVKEWQKNNR